MKDNSPERRLDGLTFLALTLGVFNVALALPLLDVLGRNPTYFVAHGLSGWQVLAFAIVVAVLVPLALAGIGVVAGIAHDLAGVATQGVVLAVLTGVWAVQLTGPLGVADLHPVMLVVLAGLVGIGVYVLVLWHPVGRPVTWLGLAAPLLVLASFTFATDAHTVAFAASADDVPPVLDFDDPAPVVMVVFDEFPLASLLEPDGTINEDLYPNFAELADTSTWYRNAMGVSHYTDLALPAVLTGTVPATKRPPTAAEYPVNVFTLLDPAYDLFAREAVARLCSACETDADSPLQILVQDTALVLAHISAPDGWDARLPPVDSSWGNFLGDAGERENTRVQHKRAVEAGRIGALAALSPGNDAGDAPDFEFVHTLLPHLPLQYLPTGREYPYSHGMPGVEDAVNPDDEWLAAHGQARHLLQVGAVDTMLGETFDEMRREGTFDESLIVITADHGGSFAPAHPRREPTLDTVGDIYPVPLFMKLPGQTTGATDDRPAPVVDVLPTILDVLGTSPDDLALDGRSLLSPRPRSGPVEVTDFKTGTTYEVDGGDVFDAVERRHETFGPLSGWDDVYEYGPHAALVGTRITDHPEADAVVATAEIARGGSFAGLEDDAAIVPTVVDGRIEFGEDVDEPVFLAVGIQDEIVAVARTYAHEGRSAQFTGLVPPDAFHEGDNRLAVYVIDDGGDELALAPLTTGSGRTAGD